MIRLDAFYYAFAKQFSDRRIFDIPMFTANSLYLTELSMMKSYIKRNRKKECENYETAVETMRYVSKFIKS